MDLSVRSIGFLIRLLNTILPVPAEEFSRERGISRRTVFRDVKAINEWLKVNGLDPVKYHRSTGFYFEPAAQKSVKEQLGDLTLNLSFKNTRHERASWIVVILLTREKVIFRKDLADRLGLSRQTIQKDLKLLAEMITPFRLKLEFTRKDGYFIIGNEQDKRKAIVHFLYNLHLEQAAPWLLPKTTGQWQRELLSSPHAYKIYLILKESESYLDVHYPDDVIELLSLQLLLLLKRYKQGKIVHLDPIEKVMVKPTPEYQASSYIGTKIREVFGIDVPDDELCYITVFLMGAKNHQPLANTSEEDMDILRSVITEMVDQFQHKANVVFKDRAALERSLFFHIKSAYYRIIHGLEFENPLAGMIIHQYTNLFKLTKEVIPHLEDVMGGKISNDELALITMHFGGWIERDFSNENHA